MLKFKAVIFDIDGTLTPQVSWEAFTRDIGASVDNHLAIYHDHLDGKIGLDESKAQLLKLWQATGNANRPYIEKMLETWPIHAEAYTIAKWLRANGLKMCLITGSLGVYAKHIARKLEADAYYANAELYFDDSGGLVDFNYTTDQAEVKLAHLKEYCQANGLQPEECIPVGDWDNDIGLFRATGNGVLINNNPDASDELRKAAWKTVGSLQEVGQLLEEL